MRRGSAAILFSFQLLFSQLLISQLLMSVPPLRAQNTGDASSSAQSAVEAVLRAQVDAWNRHDLDAFMTGYWKSPELTFFSGATEHNGWQAAIDRYRAAYAGPGHEMGKLDFSGLRVEILCADAAFVRGAWHLTMPDGKTPHGIFTLVFRKFPEGWRIVHDHTSLATE